LRQSKVVDIAIHLSDGFEQTHREVGPEGVPSDEFDEAVLVRRQRSNCLQSLLLISTQALGEYVVEVLRSEVQIAAFVQCS
jgi:hypothetical protein